MRKKRNCSKIIDSTERERERSDRKQNRKYLVKWIRDLLFSLDTRLVMFYPMIIDKQRKGIVKEETTSDTKLKFCGWIEQKLPRLSQLFDGCPNREISANELFG
jgi:hypothetical protein